jgi:hypothetical protein
LIPNEENNHDREAQPQEWHEQHSVNKSGTVLRARTQRTETTPEWYAEAGIDWITIPDLNQVPTDPITSIEQIGSIWQLNLSPKKWLIPDLLVEGSVTMIASASGTGKSYLAYFLAGAVAHGWNVFGGKCEQRPVLYLDAENPGFEVKERLLDKLGIEESPNLKVWGGWYATPPPGPGDSLVIEWAKEHKPLLIWDSIIAFNSGDEQSATQVRAFMKLFDPLKHAGATVIILHHTGKGENTKEYRGSSDIKGAVDMAYVLEGDGETIDELELTPTKQRLGFVPKWKLSYTKGKGFRTTTVATGKAVKADATAIIKKILTDQPGLKTGMVTQMAKAHGLKATAIDKALNDTTVFGFESGEKNTKHWHVKV